MGYLFTMLYLLTAYLAPTTLFGDLAQYHLELIIAVLAIAATALNSKGSRLNELTQTWACVGLCAAVSLSIVFSGWGAGGGARVLFDFLPDISCFFLIYLNFRKKWQLQSLAGMLCLAEFFILYQAQQAAAIGDHESPYLLYQTVDEVTRASIIRIKGLSFLGDPNDFAQFMVALIPCMFLFWARGKIVRNLLLVYVPCGILLYSIFLTHSRGSMVALMVMCMVAGRRKIGLVPAAVIGAALFAALSAAGFSGGREVASGEDRIGAWSVGIQLIRAHPLFGVGYGRFPEYNVVTAHNTFVVCAAELGLLGVCCWIFFMLVTIRNAFVANKDPNPPLSARQRDRLDREAAGLSFRRNSAELPAAALAPAAALVPAAAGMPAGMVHRDAARMFSPGAPALATAEAAAPGESAAQFPWEEVDGEKRGMETGTEDGEIRRMNGLMVISFAGFLAAGWFLSRAYTICLYVNAGMAAALYRMAYDRGLTPPEMPVKRAMKFTAIACAVLLGIVYTIVLTDHLMPR